MTTIDKIEPGSAFAITIMRDNHELETFHLALVRDKSRLSGIGYDYIFLNDKGEFTDSVYSGGTTGVGVHTRDIRFLDQAESYYEVLATKPEEIIKLASEIYQARIDKQNADKIKTDKDTVAIQAAIHSGEPIELYKSTNYLVILTPAYGGYSNSGVPWSPARLSIRIEYAIVNNSKNPTTISRSKNLISMKDLFTPKGNISTYAKNIFGDETKAIVTKITNKVEEIKNTVREIKDAD